MNEKIKKVLKAVGIAAAGLFLLWLFFAVESGLSGKNFQKDGGVRTGKDMMVGAGSLSPGSMGISSEGINVPSRDASVNASSTFESKTMMPSSQLADDVNSVSVDKKIIKTGDLSLKVEKTEDAAQRITAIAEENGGAVFFSNFFQGSRNSLAGSITVKIPFSKFNDVFSAIKKVATQVVSESTSAQDVTEEYADLQAQLKNKRAEEESFVAILKRAGEIDDVLKATREVARVRGEIERLEGRIKFLNAQTDMSTVTVQLAEDVEISPVTEGWRPWQVVKQSIKMLLKNSQNFVDGVIEFVIVTLPTLVVYLLVLWVVWIVGRKIYRKFKNSQPPREI